MYPMQRLAHLAPRLPFTLHHDSPDSVPDGSRIASNWAYDPDLGGDVALLVLLIVGVVVGQTWVEWREQRRRLHMPEWASGLGMAALVATPLTATASFASMWYQDSLGLLGRGIGAWFWFEMGFALCAMGIVVAATRRKRLRTLMVIAGVLTVALWIGLALST